MFPGIGQAQNTPYDLLHIHLTGAVRQRSKDIRKGAVPTLFQGIDCNDKANRTLFRQQVHIFQLVDLRRLDGNLLCWNVGCNQALAQFFKGRCIFCALGLRLKQHDGANVAATLFVGIFCVNFQCPLHLDGIMQHILLAVAIHHDDRQLDHVLAFQVNRIHNGDDVAFLSGRCRQIQHKAGIEVLQHLLAWVTARMVAFVHNDQRMQLINDLHQGGRVGIFQRHIRFAQCICQRNKAAVLLLGLEPLLLATERIVRQHHDGKLLVDRRDIEVLPHQKLFFGIHFYTAAKGNINFLAVRMCRVTQCSQGLGQDSI